MALKLTGVLVGMLVAAGCSTATAPTPHKKPPPDPPICCGCLCVDPTWSCSQETCLIEDGTAQMLAPEAGFFELAGGSYVSFAKPPRETPRARVWYSFQPAETDPDNKPLIILFNGGPGGPALGVLGFNIGHSTFDIDYTHGATSAENPYRWTDFANLLYVDQPGTGFSYHLPRADGSAPKLSFDVFNDAADYLRMIFRFVARHPQLGHAPIIIAGESYGGLRSAAMTKIMLDYRTLIDSSGVYQDTELYNEIVDFLDARRSDIDPTAWKPADIAQVFTHQILTDPFFTDYQIGQTLKWNQVPGCFGRGDPLECDVSTQAFKPVVQHLVDTVTDPDAISSVLRCDISRIEWLQNDNRAGAYPRKEDSGLNVDLSKLVDALGVPEVGDAYYVFMNNETRNDIDIFDNLKHGETALRSLHDIPTFITHGAYDLLFNGSFIPPSLMKYNAVVSSVTWNHTEPSEAARPGEILIVYKGGLPYGGGARTVRFPPYLAGHSVSHERPGELKADVETWLATGR